MNGNKELQKGERHFQDTASGYAPAVSLVARPPPWVASHSSMVINIKDDFGEIYACR